MRWLSKKYILWICIVFITVGLLIYIPLAFYLPKKITTQILKRDVKIAEYISHEIKAALLTKDNLALNLSLYDNLENLADAEYIFIQDENNTILAHTFHQGFPADLIKINPFNSKTKYKIKKFLVEEKEFYDLAVPILAGGSDSLHLGISLKSGKKEIADFARFNYYVAGAIFTGLGFGFVVLLILGMREARRLSSIEERNRIALELHDGIAQSLANVVIRLEICQKLFNKEPQQILEELSQLKENAKELVARARSVIANLKGSSNK